MVAATSTTGEEVEGSWWTAPVQRPANIKVKDSGVAEMEFLIMVTVFKD